jgi:hypothetical protein
MIVLHLLCNPIEEVIMIIADARPLASPSSGPQDAPVAQKPVRERLLFAALPAV